MKRGSICRKLQKTILVVSICVTGSSLGSCAYKFPVWLSLDDPFARFLHHPSQPTRFVDTVGSGAIEIDLVAISHWSREYLEFPYELVLIYDVKLLSDDGTLEIRLDKINCSYRGEVLIIRDKKIREETEVHARGELSFQHQDISGAQMSHKTERLITIDLSKAIYYNGELVSVDTILAME